ncbi:hypothetical protein [Blastococcus sp. SYSU D01042]
MTEQLTMNRVIHAAVRRDLDRLADALGRMADGDRPRAQALDHAYRNLRTELTHHHEGDGGGGGQRLGRRRLGRSPQWKAVEKKLRSQPLPVAGRFFAWLTDGMTDENRAFGRRYFRDVAPTWR